MILFYPCGFFGSELGEVVFQGDLEVWGFVRHGICISIETGHEESNKQRRRNFSIARQASVKQEKLSFKNEEKYKPMQGIHGGQKCYLLLGTQV